MFNNFLFRFVGTTTTFSCTLIAKHTITSVEEGNEFLERHANGTAQNDNVPNNPGDDLRNFIAENLPQ